MFHIYDVMLRSHAFSIPFSPPGLHPYCSSPLFHCSTQCEPGPPSDDANRPLLLNFFTQVMLDDASICEILCLIAIVEPLPRAASVWSCVQDDSSCVWPAAGFFSA